VIDMGPAPSERERDVPLMTTASPAPTDSQPATPAPSAPSPTAPTDLPTQHPKLLAWVNEVAELTQPDRIHWIDGSDEEYARLTTELVEAGTLVKLDETQKPNSFWARTDPRDVARVEERTFICSVDEADSGATNNWMAPAEMKAIMTELYRGSMRGRTMYVIPFCMGPLTAENPMFGVEITDSAYVVVSMRIMARSGRAVLDRMGTDAAFVPCLHSVGAPLEPGQQDVPWPCSDTKYVTHYPEERAIWSYGSGYGGNSLLGKKCYSLRIASAIARDEGWLAEHMLILKLISPEKKVYYVAAAFPSACGKTNLAMLDPTLDGWEVETLGDDIAPGTGWKTNPNAMRTIEKGNSVFTNVALTDDGDVWWEGYSEEPPQHLTDWKGRDWAPDSDEPSSHPNSRFCTPLKQCPIVADEYEDPDGVPISAILFGGRRATTVPLVTESRDWSHGVFMGATLSSETTAAAVGKVGVVRRDPMAMLPFIGYNAGDYFNHWITVGKDNDESKLPRIFYVNWFRKDEHGKFVWPGFSENGRVLKWVIERIEGKAAAVETPIGHVPTVDAIDVSGLDLSTEALQVALAVDPDEWKAEIPLIEDWFAKIGDKLPAPLKVELDTLKLRLGLDT
jgi:phosphoenolpyruvate carboxykinase (GTP)